MSPQADYDKLLFPSSVGSPVVVGHSENIKGLANIMSATVSSMDGSVIPKRTYRILYRDCIMGPGRILVQDPCPFSLPEILTAARVWGPHLLQSQRLPPKVPLL